MAMKFPPPPLDLLWASSVAIVLTTLSIGAGAQAQPLIDSQLGEITSVIPRNSESLEKASKRRSWLAIERVGIALPNDRDNHRVTLFGFLPTPCHEFGWEIPSEASADGVLHIQAWSIDSGHICVQAIQPFHAELSFRDRPFAMVAINGVIAENLTNLIQDALPLPEFPSPRWIRSEEAPTSAPAPLPLAAILAGWHSARRLRRRCRGR